MAALLAVCTVDEQWAIIWFCYQKVSWNSLKLQHNVAEDYGLKVFPLHDNSHPHMALSIADTILRLGFEILQHPPYSLVLRPQIKGRFERTKIWKW